MIRMNAYDRQLQTAIEHLDNINPMFDFPGSDRTAQARQLKTWWGKALADDHLYGHDPSGPIEVAADQLTDRQLVLLSALQRGARGVTGDWGVTAAPESGDALSLTVAGQGLTAEATAVEVKSGVSFRGPLRFTAEDGSEPLWPQTMLHRTTNLADPVVDLSDVLAVSDAFARSPFAGLHDSFDRTSYDTIDAFDEEIDLDWRAQEATPNELTCRALASAAGISVDDVPDALSAVLEAAVANGHSIPEPLPARAVAPQQPAAGVSNMGAEILAGLGINVGDTTVIGIPAGGSMSIEIGAGDGGLSSSGLPTAGTGAPAFIDPEEAFLAECATSLGIPTNVFRGIVKGDGEDA